MAGSDPDLTNLQVIEELVAVWGIYGEALCEVSPPALLAAVQAVCEGREEAAAVAAATHAGCHCSGTLKLQADTSADAAAGTRPSAILVFTLPPGYPLTAPLQCHVTSAKLPRVTVDAWSQELQQQAMAAQGQECLHELAGTLQQHLDVWQQQQQQQNAQDSLQQPEAEGGRFRRVLLRLDHMRDRAGYTSHIMQWTAELQLTGWLLFWQKSLILILLEGRSKDVSTYLKRARTVCVDVDSAGRKCRERMMTILEDSAAGTPGLNAAGSDSAANNRGGQAQAGTPPASMQRAYNSFRELNPASLQEVVQHVAAVLGPDAMLGL